MDFYVSTLITLAKNSSLALYHIGRAPRNVKMVKRAKPFLHIHAKSHLEGRANDYGHKTVLKISEQQTFLRFTIGIVNKRDLIFGQPHCHQQALQLIIEIEPELRSGRITEHHLNQLLITSSLIDIHNVLRTAEDLGIGIKTERHIDESHIKRSLTSIGCDFKKIIHGFMNPLMSNIIGSCRNLLEVFLKILSTDSYRIRITVQFWNTHVLINVIEIGNRRENRGKLRNVVESCKSCSKVIAVCIDIDLKLGCLLSKHTYPRIEVLNSKELKFTVLQILLKHEDIGNRIGDRCSGCKHDSATVILSLNAVNLVHHSLALARPCLIKALNANDSTIKRDVFVVVRLINKECVDTKLIKRNLANVLRHILLESLH